MNKPASLFTATLIAACVAPSDPPAPAPAVIACNDAAIVEGWEVVSPTDLDVTFDAPLVADAAITRTDLSRFLGELWRTSITVHDGTPDVAKPRGIWLSTSEAARTLTGPAPENGWRMKRVEEGSRTVWVVSAADGRALTSGAYALLERLGVKFFHPMQTFVPQLPGPRLPASLDLARAPGYTTRGLQPHTLHPIEAFRSFMEPGDATLNEGLRYIDWLVATGQNQLQFPLLATVPWDAWTVHARALLDHAHARGVKVMPVVQVWAGSSLQNNYVLMQKADDPVETMHGPLDRLIALGFDGIELALGEFSGAPPEAILERLDHAVSHVLAAKPGLTCGVQIHVGNYDDLWVKFRGEERMFFYHLPKYADPRLRVSVHTLSFFDLYRDWATYAHPDFKLQRDFLLSQLGQREVWYFPESAYWINADIDVPLFLPMTAYARWLDMSRLAAEARERGLPPLDGHVTFTSGHEWGFWLTDYLAARQTWEPEITFEALLAEFGTAFGDCSQGVTKTLGDYVALQNRWLFDGRLAAYVQGEDLIVELGYMIGLETHPRRVPFEELLKMSEAELASFEGKVVEGLEAFANGSAPLLDDVASRCRGSGPALKPWCDELADGIEVTMLRARHAAALYRATLALARGQETAAPLTKAQEATAAARVVVDRREPHYRYDVGRLVDAYENPTIYAYGLLRQAHTLCYWDRREKQLSWLIDNGQPISTDRLPTCTQ